MKALKDAMALAIAAGSLFTAAHAQPFNPADWRDARPVTSVSVTRTSQPGVFRVSTTVADAETARVLGKPFLLTRPGVPGTIEFGSQTAVMVRLVVTVDEAGQSAAYRAEVLKAGAVQSAHTGTAAVQDGT